MSNQYPPVEPSGPVLPMMVAPPPPAHRAEVVALSQTGGAHLPEIATLAGLLLMAGIAVVAIARKVRA